jgi:signal transduction histidine kinase
MLHDPPPDPGESSTVAKLQQQLRSSNEVQAKFLSFLNHDLRGELNGVLLTIELLKLQLSKEPRLAGSVEDLDAMRRAMLDAVGVMDRFVKAERLRHGRIQPNNVVVDARQLLGEVAGEFADQAKKKEIDLTVQHGGPVQITTDRDLLKMIVQNVVSNAVKFCGGCQVRLSAKAGDGSLGPRIDIVDGGPGIAIERQRKLFEPFVGDQLPGRCIGLYLVRQATDLLGAKVSVVSQPGKGAAFCFEFPR